MPWLCNPASGPKAWSWTCQLCGASSYNATYFAIPARIGVCKSVARRAPPELTIEARDKAIAEAGVIVPTRGDKKDKEQELLALGREEQLGISQDTNL